MRKYLRHCRHHFIYAGGFSFFINVLLLTVPLFMLQVFDRVLVSRSQETLLVLSLLATGALFVHLLLDMLRAHLLLAAGLELDSLVEPPVLASLLHRAIRHLRNEAATLIVISHRASLLSEVDKLLMLQDGRVSLFGPRDEVLVRLQQAAQVQATPYVIHGGKP